MVRLTVHYDGKVLIPDETVDLPTGIPLQVTVQTDDPRSDKDPIQALDGLGKRLWQDIDPVEYQRKEREGWEVFFTNDRDLWGVQVPGLKSIRGLE